MAIQPFSGEFNVSTSGTSDMGFMLRPTQPSQEVSLMSQPLGLLDMGLFYQ